MDFTQARFNMVEQQIRTWEVLNFDILDILGEIPREEFVSTSQRLYAYSDMHLPLQNGDVMIEPKIVARLIQGLNLKKDDRVLEIGTGSGYATAILSKLAAHVTSVDVDPNQQDLAKNVLNKLGYNNIDFIVGNGFIRETIQSSYDAIYVGGAVYEMQKQLFDHLTSNGRMVIVVGNYPVQKAELITRNHNNFDNKVLFDTFIPYLNDNKTDMKNSTFKF